MVLIRRFQMKRNSVHVLMALVLAMSIPFASMALDRDSDSFGSDMTFMELEDRGIVNTSFIERKHILSSMTFSEISNTEISEEAYDFLRDHNIDITNEVSQFISKEDLSIQSENISPKEVYVGNLNDDILALKNATIAHDFSDEQIQAYVDRLFENTTVLLDLRDVTKDEVSDEVFRAPNRPENGVGFEAQTYANYNQFTSYATLPHVNISNLNEIVWHFVSPVTSRGRVFDITLRKGANSWAGGYLLDGGGGFHDIDFINDPQDGDKVYYNIYKDSDGYIMCKIVDGNFSKTILSARIWLNYSEFNRIAFNKQITMTWNSRPLRGSSIYGGTFESSYVYKKGGPYYKFEDVVNPNRYGTFGSNAKWGSERYTTWTKRRKWAGNAGVEIIDDVNISIPSEY